jgi:hypothetical protein
MRRLVAAALGIVLGCGGCASTRVTTPVVRTAMHGTALRAALFESTLRVLDEHPAYVDEFVARARRHPRTLDRFNANYAPLLAEPATAALTARHLARNPDGLRQILVSTLDEARPRPAARRVIADAMRLRSDLSSRIVGQNPAAAMAVARSTVRAAERDPASRRTFLAGLRATSRATARLIVRDRRTLGVMARAFADEGEARVVESLQRALPGRQPGEPPPSRRGGGPPRR